MQYNLRSDHQGCHGYIQINFLTIGGPGGLTGLGGGQTMNDTEGGGLTDLGDGQNVNDTEAGGLTGQLWWSNHHGTGAGGLTDPW
jgi:hypothetical protein